MKILFNRFKIIKYLYWRCVDIYEDVSPHKNQFNIKFNKDGIYNILLFSISFINTGVINGKK